MRNVTNKKKRNISKNCTNILSDNHSICAINLYSKLREGFLRIIYVYILAL